MVRFNHSKGKPVKAITEFASFTLKQAIATKNSLSTEGKTPEEISATLGTNHKMEGDKLKHFINALDVASNNMDGLKRVLVVSLAEGENPPAKAVKVEETYYVPDIFVPYTPKPQQKGGPKGRGGKGGRDGGKGKPRDRDQKAASGDSKEKKSAPEKA